MVILAFCLSFTSSVDAKIKRRIDQQTYDEAYEKSIKTGDTLLVLIGAEWCPPCQEQKSTIKKMRLNKVNFAYVDVDKQPKYAKGILGKRPESVPVIVIYKKRNDTWERTVVVGKKSAKELREQIAQ